MRNIFRKGREIKLDKQITLIFVNFIEPEIK